MSTHEIISSRVLKANVKTVYESFENPEHLAKWWGPEGFTNTFHEFDLRPGGKWILTMHGPDKGNYENSSEFTIVNPLQLVAWKRFSKPLFAMEVQFEKIEDFKTRILFKMTFDSAEETEKMRKYVEPKNEENFDRLERELAIMK